MLMLLLLVSFDVASLEGLSQLHVIYDAWESNACPFASLAR